MQLMRALLSVLLTAALAFAPVAAGAMEQTTHAATALASADEASLSDHPDGAGCMDAAGAGQEAPETDHCGACCLAHAGVVLPAAPAVFVCIVVWGAGIQPEAGPPFAVPARTYGLKRPPRT
jgi:hypothetical protein